MNSSLKIGAVSGLVAGFVAGIVHTVSAKIPASIGLYEPGLPLITIAQNAYGVNVVLGIVFGVIFGVIYSRAYGVIPSKGVIRGFFFGLILLLLSWIRMSTFTVAYGFYLNASGQVLAAFLQFIIYGLALVFLYEFLRSRYYPAKEKPKVITYDVKGGILPGAIAGFVGGFMSSVSAAIATVTGLFGPRTFVGVPEKLILDFWLSQAGAHIFLDLIWGAILGAIFAWVYNVVPGRGMTKGLCYGLANLLIGTVLFSAYMIGWGALLLGLWGISNSILVWISYGLVLGALYRKPSD